jgi:predicted SAM-dependent methyltransferase
MDTLINIDLDSLIQTSRRIVIELGAGTKKSPGRICIDKVDLPNVDIVADIERGLAFLPDNSIDEIHCRSVLEHIDNFEELMREIVRVLKPAGRAYIFVPRFSNPYFYSNYTHRRSFGLYTFYYFVDDTGTPHAERTAQSLY